MYYGSILQIKDRDTIFHLRGHGKASINLEGRRRSRGTSLEKFDTIGSSNWLKTTLICVLQYRLTLHVIYVGMDVRIAVVWDKFYGLLIPPKGFLHQ